ncbi:hypothetical protein T06_4964 [Trichinella sp. T6]|nr:hypothetical protein T06_4964 [Trichinella sp. T6]
MDEAMLKRSWTCQLSLEAVSPLSHEVKDLECHFETGFMR